MAKSQKKKLLDLGCGENKYPGAIGVDINPKSKADIIHDLNKFPYPFGDNQFDLIFAQNIIEHLDDIVKVMEELYRIGKNGAKIYIRTSHFSSVDSFTDPTHKHFFTSCTFDYFIPGSKYYQFHYSKAKFKKRKVSVGPIDSYNLILKIPLILINKFLIPYERRLAFIFPVGTISYELEIIKESNLNH